MTDRGATRELAHWIATITWADLDARVIHHGQRILLDFLAAAIAGSRSSLADGVRRYVSTAIPGDTATIIGGSRSSAAGAAFANGASAHALELDDGYTLGACHPSSATLPAILALAEEREAAPQQVLMAALVGVEVACRVTAAGHPATWERGFHNTPLGGVFGSAAGCSLLLGLDGEQVGSALGHAGSRASGLFEFLTDGTDVKRLHPGQAARDGLEAAQLAAIGITGPPTVLEGKYGYFSAYADGRWHPERLLGGLGADWALLDTYFKPYPCCRNLHPVIDALFAIQAGQAVNHENVERVEVETYTGAARHDGQAIATLLDAQMSIPYAVAVALRYGKFGLDELAPEVCADTEIGRLMQSTQVRATEEQNSHYPGARPALVTLHLADGTTLSHHVMQPYGEPGNPLTDDALNAKFASFVEPVVGVTECAAIMEAVWQLDDITHIVSRLRGTQRD